MKFLAGILFAIFVLVPGCVAYSVGSVGTAIGTAVDEYNKGPKVTPDTSKREARAALDARCERKGGSSKAKCLCASGRLYDRLSTRQYRYFAAVQTRTARARYSEAKRYGFSRNAYRSYKKNLRHFHRSRVCARVY